MKLIFVLFTTIVIGCMENNFLHSPNVVAEKYYDALIINDMEAASLYATDRSQLPNDPSVRFTMKEYILSKANIDKNYATIHTTTNDNNGEITFETMLEKIDGNWKINVKQTMLEMFESATANDKWRIKSQSTIDIK